MAYDRPIVLSIAGFDPSGGAGVLADVKTFEQNKCLGFSVISANTIQTEDTFIAANWIPVEEIIAQMIPLFKKYKISFVKIGIIEDLETLTQIVRWLKRENPYVQIVWDPVVSSTTGFKLMNAVQPEILEKILSSILLITPNISEVKSLSNTTDIQQASQYLANFCPVYLKGGHSESELGVDYLIERGKRTKLSPLSTEYYSKHGSGCVLSSAIISNLAQGKSLINSCELGKRYIEQILGSNHQLLAYHHV